MNLFALSFCSRDGCFLSDIEPKWGGSIPIGVDIYRDWLSRTYFCSDKTDVDISIQLFASHRSLGGCKDAATARTDIFDDDQAIGRVDQMQMKGLIFPCIGNHVFGSIEIEGFFRLRSRLTWPPCEHRQHCKQKDMHRIEQH